MREPAEFLTFWYYRAPGPSIIYTIQKPTIRSMHLNYYAIEALCNFHIVKIHRQSDFYLWHQMQHHKNQLIMTFKHFLCWIDRRLPLALSVRLVIIMSKSQILLLCIVLLRLVYDFILSCLTNDSGFFSLWTHCFLWANVKFNVLPFCSHWIEYKLNGLVTNNDMTVTCNQNVEIIKWKSAYD